MHFDHVLLVLRAPLPRKVHHERGNVLLQLENFPIVVAVVEGQLQRVDGATSSQPLVSAPDAVSMEQAGRGHLLLRRDDDTATLLRVACDPVEAP